MGRVMQIAAFSLAEVSYAVGGDIGYQVQESVKSAKFRIRTKQENVSGVFLPAFESFTTEGTNDFGLTGLGKGGQQVQKCRETYARAVETLVELASLQVRAFRGRWSCRRLQALASDSIRDPRRSHQGSQQERWVWITTFALSLTSCSSKRDVSLASPPRSHRH